VRVSVVMEHRVLADRWGTETWEATGVVCDERPLAAPQVIHRDTRTTRFLHTGLEVPLRRDEAEGYYLNITSPHPRLFVLWRKDDATARPHHVTVSFNEAARWMDGGESVDGVALPVELLPWIGAYVAEHYKPEPKKKGRWAS